MIPDERERSNEERTVRYTCGCEFAYIGNVVIESRCPRCDMPMVGRT